MTQMKYGDIVRTGLLAIASASFSSFFFSASPQDLFFILPDDDAPGVPLASYKGNNSLSNN